MRPWNDTTFGIPSSQFTIIADIVTDVRGVQIAGQTSLFRKNFPLRASRTAISIAKKYVRLRRWHCSNKNQPSWNINSYFLNCGLVLLPSVIAFYIFKEEKRKKKKEFDFEKTINKNHVNTPLTNEPLQSRLEKLLKKVLRNGIPTKIKIQCITVSPNGAFRPKRCSVRIIYVHINIRTKLTLHPTLQLFNRSCLLRLHMKIAVVCRVPADDESHVIYFTPNSSNCRFYEINNKFYRIYEIGNGNSPLGL